MEYMEILNILKKEGIDALADRFTQEDVENGYAFDSFDIYMRKNYPNFKYEICTGSTKAVIVPKNEDWVLKIPFAGYEDWDEQPCWENKETGEWEYDDDYDAFFPFEGVENGDYCAREVRIYQNAIIEGVDNFFAEIEYIGNAGNFPIYLQKKVTPYYYNENRKEYTEAERTSLRSKYSYSLERLPAGWCLDFISAVGEEIFKDFLNFIKEYNVNDLHSNNVAYKNNLVCICDYSGYFE